MIDALGSALANMLLQVAVGLVGNLRAFSGWASKSYSRSRLIVRCSLFRFAMYESG